MTRFGSLGIEQIQALAAKRDDANQVKNSINHVIVRLFELVKIKFSKGTRLTSADLDEVFSDIDALMTARYQSFHAIRKSIPATRVHPKGAKKETIYLSLLYDPEIRCYELTSFRLTGTSRKLGYMFSILPFAISEHAVQRLMERVPGEADALEVITRNTINWLLHLMPLTMVAEQRNRNHMAIPAEGLGLLFGDFIPTVELDRAAGQTWDHLGAVDTTPNVKLINGPTYLVKTFVHAPRLRPEQLSSMERMVAYEQRNRQIAAEYRNLLFWPDAKIINSSPSEIPEAEISRMDDEFKALFDDDSLLEGLKAGRDYDVTPGRTDFSLPIEIGKALETTTSTPTLK